MGRPRQRTQSAAAPAPADPLTERGALAEAALSQLDAGVLLEGS